MTNQIYIEEYKLLRTEIAIRLKLLHHLIAIGNILWAVFLIFGIWVYQPGTEIFYTYLLIIPIVFAGLTFNYQDNQRTMEATARYVEDKLKPKFENGLEWEEFFASQKKIYQLYSANKIFALLVPFLIPIILLTTQNLSNFQITLAAVDILLFVAILINFRYKLYRVK